MLLKVKLHLFATLAMACVLLTLGGCVSGPSSGRLQHDLVKSWLFKSTDSFYPAGTQEATSYPTLNQQSIASLERDLNSILRDVLELHQRNSVLLGKYFNQRLSTSVSAVAVIDNQGQPIAKSFVNEAGKLEIRVDVKILQATFRGSLVSSIRDDQFGESSLTYQSDDTLLADFLQFKKEVSTGKTGNSYGDLINTIHHRDDLDEGRWFKMADFKIKSQGIESRYTGTLMFLLAHELGHFALNHHHEGCDVTKCDRFAEREREADTYAGILLGAQVAPLGVFGEDSFFRFRI